jgi:Zn-dependent metalloprotease
MFSRASQKNSYKSPPICFIVPPHIYEHIAKHGDDEARQRALYSLTISERFRGRREVVGLMPSIFAVAGQLRRTIFDTHNRETLPGDIVRTEGQSVTHGTDVTEAYDYSGNTYKFYKEVYNRNSVDDRGMRLDSTVHYGQQYDNAFWNGTQMVYGDGDGVVFQRFTIALDVIGHELTHGVTQNTAGLDYQDQPGALNESISDCFGSMVKQYALGQSAEKADWLIGAKLFTPDVKGKALRSMMAPGTAYDDPKIGKDPQPATMDDYVKTSSDNGGVHINSGIPNHAFCIIATDLGGNSWEKAGKVWYSVLTRMARHDTNFSDFANMTIQEAGSIFGQGSPEQKVFQKGWAQVKVIK